MKKYIFSIIFLALSVLPVSAFSLVISDGPLPGCIEYFSRHPIAPEFKNFYHHDFNTHIGESLFNIWRKDTCWFYTMGGSSTPGEIDIRQVIPVYYPKKSAPIAYQVIYLGQDYKPPKMLTGANVFWGITPKPNRPLRGLYAGAWNNIYGRNPDGNSFAEGGGAYFKSLEEPFRSAPQLQMYYYLGKPLLVARSGSGEVMNVYFQGREVPNPVERAKKYLGEKWYHP